MLEDTEFIKKRFIELANKADTAGYFTFTDFLGLPEQSAFIDVLPKLKGIPYKLFGGTDGCERVMIRFGDEEDIGYDQPFPILCLCAEPLSQKFADKLTHRDFLGALMNLGIDRSTLGDILICDNVGYIFASEDITDFITAELRKVKHTDIRVYVTEDIPTSRLFRTEPKRIQANSERIDAIVAKVFNMSRDDSLTLFKKKLVYINGRLCENNSQAPKPEDKISVRGYGKMIYKGYDGLSKKGKLNITVELYV